MVQRLVTCIGSRDLPEDKGIIIDKLCKFLVNNNCKMRSGGAGGTDRRFQSNFEILGGNKEIYLPWNGFEKLYVDNRDFFLVKSDICRPYTLKYHPNPNALSKYALLLMDRNAHQVLGLNLDLPSDFIVAYTENAAIKGGTAQALRMAKDLNIPVVNVGHNLPYEAFEEQINTILNLE